MKDNNEYRKNVKKPQENELGKMQLEDMNIRHNTLSLWGLDQIDLSLAKNILDIGCGGGKNIANMLNATKDDVKVYGVDYSSASVNMSLTVNKDAVANGRTKVFEGSVEKMPFDDKSFDVVTAFETIYFWNINKGFSEVKRILKNNGLFMITNEAYSREGMEKDMEIIGMEIYNEEEISVALSNAGFTNIEMHFHENGTWLNVIAEAFVG